MTILQTSSPSYALSMLDSMSLLFNPYPLVSQAILERINSMAHLHILRFAIILIVTHGIILVQTSLIFFLKFFREKDAQSRRSFSPWKKCYRANQSLLYLVPNRNLLIDLLQIIGCASMKFFALVTHRACSVPESVSPNVNSSSFFWLAVSFAPGFAGFWLNGWSSIYIGFLSPSRGESKRSTHRILQHPLLMNSICIGVPIVIIVYFVSIGIKISIKHRQLVDIYIVLMTTIAQFSENWKPNDPSSFQKNQDIFNILTEIYQQGDKIGILFQFLACGWVLVSLFIIMVNKYIFKRRLPS